VAGSAGNGGTSGRSVPDDVDARAGTSGAGTHDQVTTSNAGNGGAHAAGACDKLGAMRCSASNAQVIEACIDDTWMAMQTCASGETCEQSEPGMASCAASGPDTPTCTGLMCDGECVTSDAEHCGKCDHNCTSLPHVSGPVACSSAGACEFSASACEPGFAHCSDNPDDGCETALSEEENCGGCGKKCPATAPVCALKAGTPAASRTYECSTGCSVDAPVLCGMSCVSTTNDAAHCGGCNRPCPAVTNGQAVCQQGVCSKKCNSGYHLCGDTCLSDKSTASCGAACSPCEVPAGARATCDGKTCGFSCISSTALKCSDGCYPNDDENCGTCGNNCAASGKLCDKGSCVQCRSNADCGGSTRYCVKNQCKRCEPGNNSTCGECQTCSSAGTCVSSGTPKVCYEDADKDTYGAPASQKKVCGGCPDGWVEDNRDCYDSLSDRENAAKVHPNQTDFFEVGYGPSKSFDYDCSGDEEPKNPDWRIEACTCRATACVPVLVSGSVPCGGRPQECTSGSVCVTLDTECYEALGWTLQSCH